jgi:hypothetical protein
LKRATGPDPLQLRNTKEIPTNGPSACATGYTCEAPRLARWRIERATRVERGMDGGVPSSFGGGRLGNAQRRSFSVSEGGRRRSARPKRRREGLQSAGRRRHGPTDSEPTSHADLCRAALIVTQVGSRSISRRVGFVWRTQRRSRSISRRVGFVWRLRGLRALDMQSVPARVGTPLAPWLFAGFTPWHAQ